MNQSETVTSIYAALAEANKAIVSPERNKTVSVRTKAGGSYEFSYATLDAIIERVRPHLTAKGLWFTQTLESHENKYRLETRVTHSSGEWIASTTPLLVGEEGNQAFGSALTFMRRYALCAILGVAADSDDDANAADGNDAAVKDKAPRKPAPSVVVAPPAPAGNTDKPHMITTGWDEAGKPHDWSAWGMDYINRIRGSANKEEAAVWAEFNQVPLDSMAEKAPAVKKRLDAAIQAHYASAEWVLVP